MECHLFQQLYCVESDRCHVGKRNKGKCKSERLKKRQIARPLCDMRSGYMQDVSV